MRKICCLLNYAPHYRMPIFRKMDDALECDFYFGSDLREDIKKADCSQLKGFRGELKNLYWGNWVWRKGVIKLAFKKEYDTYIITGEPHTLSLIPFNLLCLLLRKKVYSWQHGIANPNLSLVKRFNQKILLSMQAGVFLYGNWARNVMIRMGYNPNKLHVVYNSLDYDTSLSLRDKFLTPTFYSSHFGNNHPVILFIGRLTLVKQLHRLLEAFVELNHLGRSCNLVVIGAGEMEHDLKQAVKRADLEAKAWFVGSVYDERRIAALLSNADVCVSPGNVGLTAIHALSYGLPVITSDDFHHQMPEFEAIEKGKSGDFYEAGNTDSLIEKLTQWLYGEQKVGRQAIRISCYQSIDQRYNPNIQVSIFRRIL